VSDGVGPGGDRPLAFVALEWIEESVRAAADETPAQLHGDLRAGNRLVDRHGVSWLVDPAAHGGHCAFDLAMMRLFGGFGTACHLADGDEFPLADGWQQRIPPRQLAPLIVHAIKFGGGYVSATADAVARSLATSS
jgi:fructosamine-3-kinase